MARAPASALVAVLLVGLVDEAAWFLPAGTLESFRADLGLSYAQAGVVLALPAPGAMVGAGFSAAADRYSRRAIAAAGAFGFAAGLALFGLGTSFPVLGLAALVLGCASTAMTDVAEVALVDLAGDDLRAYLARSNLLGTVGDLLGPALVAGVALAGLSWRDAFLVAAVLATVYATALALVPLPAPAPRQSGPEESLRSPLRAVLRDPVVWVLGLVLALLGPFDEPLLGFTIALLEQERGASAVSATLVTLVGLTGGLLTYGVLAPRVEGEDDHRLLLWGVLTMTAAALAIAVVPVVAVVALAAFGATVGLNLAWLAVQHRMLTARPGQAGTTLAVVSGVELSGFWLPAAIGALADRLGLVPAVASYGLLGALLAVLGVLAEKSRRE